MEEHRRITRACATRDWSSATHAEVLVKHRGSHLLQRFLSDRSLDHCYAGTNVLDRARNRPRGVPGAGSHVLGNFHVKAPAARRAWLWRDTGELDPAGELSTTDWMTAEGPRRQGHSSDLQVSHADILFDPHDAWLPGEDDYVDLVVEQDERWLPRGRAAVAQAAIQAAEHRGQLIAVDIDRIAGHVIQGMDEDIQLAVGVFEQYSERWAIVSAYYLNHTPVAEETAFALARAAFPDDADIEQLAERTSILDGACVIEPGLVYAWCAIV